MENAGERRQRAADPQQHERPVTPYSSVRDGGYAAGTSVVLAQPAPPPRVLRSRPGHSPAAQTPRRVRVLGASGEQAEAAGAKPQLCLTVPRPSALT
ncbi:hypothetical protein VTN00DRAFT_6167 [Thermoascus crustaceus]|uniref:uncharacterized protein n=1 Tax=Thermoascus crustaceus TaxID=5088 RepID=UPI0037437D95